jgi:hypothetical protein
LSLSSEKTVSKFAFTFNLYRYSVETVGREAYSDLPSVATLQAMREVSPVHHLHKVKAPVLMLLGAVDLR